jgi:hypothetical protein
MKICRRTAGCTLFDHNRDEDVLARVESRTSWQETKKIQIKFFVTCNKNGQQQDDSNKAEV